jgi:hypothetical protein
VVAKCLQPRLAELSSLSTAADSSVAVTVAQEPAFGTRPGGPVPMQRQLQSPDGPANDVALPAPGFLSV